MSRFRRRLLLLATAAVLLITLSVQGRLPGPFAVGALLCLVVAWAAVTLVRSIAEHRSLLADGAWSATREQEDASPGRGEDVRLTGLRFLVHDVVQDGDRTEELHNLLRTLAARRGGSVAEIPEARRLRDLKTLSETIRGIEEL